MKKKFDFSAELNSTEARTNREYREQYEEENKLLHANIQELMKLNDNIHEMRTMVQKLAKAVQQYEYKITDATLKQAENLGNGFVNKLSKDLDAQYSKFET